MDDRVLDKVKIKVPDDLAGKISEIEVMNTLLNKAMNKMEYYRIRCIEMEEKYGVDFNQFKEKFINEHEEIFADGDDLVRWQGYFHAFKEWKNTYEDLRRWMS